MKKTILKSWIIILLLWISPLRSMAYSVLTHEALIDANWDKVIVPLLKLKYPATTDEQLKEAHAYAYGGAVAPDMGYYPFGSKLFTNLAHYVRSGDFVEALLDSAQNLNEYAFAVGALCHYNADKYGHSLGVNVSVPIEYPKDREQFGNVVTYAEDKTSHIRVEFAFDVLQTARGNYASTSYHNYIGFKVSKELLERAFFKTYGLHIDDLFSNFDRAVSTFRWAVKNLFPEITKAAWASKKKDIKKVSSTATSRRFIYRMHRIKYRHEFGKNYDQPKFFARVLALFIKIMPKIGPLKALKFKAPGPDAEKYFVRSFDTVVVHYVNDLALLHTGDIVLKNIDYDTGKKTEPGEYQLADESYCDLLVKLKEKNFENLSPSLKQNILSFFSNRQGDLTVKKDSKEWKEASDALEQLKIAQPKMN